ncbi:MAG TPA: DNA-binding domain-containing protein [Pirellulales bacterium]|nr:DNA-binding domain-containing protein [Pirellulales bacterium]
MTPDDESHLARVQRWMQAVISHPGGVGPGAESDEAQQHLSVAPDEIERVISPSVRMSGEERLAIYANAYFARLLECMRAVFPFTAKTVGEEAFDELALGYLERYPSRSYTLDRLGAEFARYLEETRPDLDDEGRPTETWPDFLIDLAGLEWAIGEVFDGPGVEGRPLLAADDLRSIPAERWPQARLITAPCLRLLALRFPLNDYYTALRDDETPPLPEPAESYLALTRREYVVRRHALERPQFELLSALAAGETVGEAIERAAHVSSDGLDALAANLERWFREWTAAGFFLRVDA